MKILLMGQYDSFAWNLSQLLSEACAGLIEVVELNKILPKKGVIKAIR
jgi:anthranilate/para-aminobenzoate synthase component II